MKVVQGDLLAVVFFAPVALAFGTKCGFDVGFAVRDDQWIDLGTGELATVADGVAARGGLSHPDYLHGALVVGMSVVDDVDAAAVVFIQAGPMALRV